METTSNTKDPNAPQEYAPNAAEEAASGHGEGLKTGRDSPRKHGKGFVYMSLGDAEECLRKIDPHEKKMSTASFSIALGHKKPEARFKHKIDAMKSFGLVEVEEDQIVKLTSLATEMLYGGNDAVRFKARATAFLNYEDFKRVFVECPKSQDHPRSYVIQFVKANLGIINDSDRFFRLFLESAHFAGLLDGEPNPEAESIRLRPAISREANGNTAASPSRTTSEFVPIPLDDVGVTLESCGLTAFTDRCELLQQRTGSVQLKIADGKITVQVQRPIQIVIAASDLLSDLPKIVQLLQQKGFQT